MAHKKSGGSTANGRDSVSKRLGVKVYGNQRVNAGGIIVRQKGTKFHPGVNTRLGRDYTLYSTIEGIVTFQKKKKMKFHGGLVTTRVVSVKLYTPQSK